jgi:hypothetical protein
MKVTQQELRQIIKEELQNVLQENQARDATESVWAEIKTGAISKTLQQLGFKYSTRSRSLKGMTWFFKKAFEDGSFGLISVNYGAPNPPKKQKPRP